MINSEPLKNAGLKITGPRMKILHILEEAHKSDRHMSVEEVYRRLIETEEDVGLATVYRVLTQFETAGLVRKHHFEGDYCVYELNQGEHHDHLLCVRCGTVTEFLDEIIEERQNIIAKKIGFTITDHALNIYGVCAKCQK